MGIPQGAVPLRRGFGGVPQLPPISPKNGGKGVERVIMKQLRLELVSAFIYLSVSLVASGIFLAVTIVGDYTWVARAGGAVWIFLLATIILMPIVIPAVRKRLG